MSLSVIYWNIDPFIFPSLGFPRWYGLMWISGIIVGYQVLKHIYKKEGRTEDELQSLALNIMVGSVIGARLGHVFFYDWAYYRQHLIEILPIRLEPSFAFTGLSGLASHGGVIGALLALVWFNRKRKLPYLYLLDRLMIGAAFLSAFIRLGNLINSEIIGKPTELPWAFVFTSVDQQPRHPSQLYEAIFYLITGFFLFRLWKKSYTNQQGYVFGLGMIMIFLQRFLVEFLKENQVGFEDQLALNMGQWLSIPMIVIGLAIMAYARRSPLS